MRKEWSGTKIFLSIYPLPPLLTPLSPIPLTTEEITGYTNEATKGANKAGRVFLVFLITCSAVSVTPSINIFESSNDFMILIISFISPFKINKVNPFSTLTAPFPLIFLSNLLIPFEVKLLANLGKLSLAKGITTFVRAFSPKLANQEPRDTPD